MIGSRRFHTRVAATMVLLLAAFVATVLSPHPASADGSQWSTTVSMPIGRGGAAVVQADDGKAFIMGGYANFLGDSNLNLRMTIQSGIPQYEFRSPAPTARAEMSGARNGNDIYVAGGRTRGGVIPPYAISLLDTFEVYHSNSDTWETLAPLPTPRAGLGLAVQGNKVYAIGGRDGGQGILKSGNVLAVVEIYDITAGTWSSGNDMPTARSDFGIAVKGSKIYAIGGWDGTTDAGDLDTVEVLNTPSGNWETIASLPTARTALTATVKGNDIFAIGGHTGIVDPDNELRTTEILDTGDDEWRTEEQLDGKRAQGGSATLSGDVYAVGGRFYPEVSPSATTGSSVEKFGEEEEEEDEDAVIPILLCVVDNGGGDFTARFGYNNENSGLVSISIGPDNKFKPNPQDRGQTTVFSPGIHGVPSAAEFTVDFSTPGNIEWELKGPDGEKRKVKADSESDVCGS